MWLRLSSSLRLDGGGGLAGAGATRAVMSEFVLTRLAAIAITVIGAVHLELWAWHGYRNVPAIGPLFLLNAIGAAGLAVLLALRGGLLGELGGLGFAASTLAAYLISVHRGLFGFIETPHGTPQHVSLGAEIAAIVILLAALALRARSSSRGSERREAARPAAWGRPAARGRP